MAGRQDPQLSCSPNIELVYASNANDHRRSGHVLYRFPDPWNVPIPLSFAESRSQGNDGEDSVRIRSHPGRLRNTNQPVRFRTQSSVNAPTRVGNRSHEVRLATLSKISRSSEIPCSHIVAQNQHLSRFGNFRAPAITEPGQLRGGLWHISKPVEQN